MSPRGNKIAMVVEVGQVARLSNGMCYTKIMSIRFSEPHSRMEDLQIKLLRQATPARKMEMLAELNASAQALALSGLRSQYPKANETELRRRLAGYLLGEDLARKVYGEISDAT